MSTPKTEQRSRNFRRANRCMPRRRLDVSTDAIDFKNPDLLRKFTTEAGKILPRRIRAVSWRSQLSTPSKLSHRQHLIET